MSKLSDVLVLTFPGTISDEYAERIRDRTKARLKEQLGHDVPVLVVSEGCHPFVLNVGGSEKESA